MRRSWSSCLVVAAAMTALPLSAEEASVTRVVAWKVRPGLEAKFEEGLKRHNDFHKKQNDALPHMTYQVMSGPNTGMYLRVAGGRHWADFDSEATWSKADQADSAVNTDPYIEATTVSYYRDLADISRPEAGGPAAMYSVATYHVKYGAGDEFSLAVKKIHEAIGKTQWPVHYAWYALTNGGDHPEYVLVIPRQKFTDFNPLEKSFDKMMEEAVGRAEADMVDRMFDKSVNGMSSELIAYRVDLSYVPAGKK